MPNKEQLGVLMPPMSFDEFIHSSRCEAKLIGNQIIIQAVKSDAEGLNVEIIKYGHIDSLSMHAKLSLLRDAKELSLSQVVDSIPQYGFTIDRLHEIETANGEPPTIAELINLSELYRCPIDDIVKADKIPYELFGQLFVGVFEE